MLLLGPPNVTEGPPYVTEDPTDAAAGPLMLQQLHLPGQQVLLTH